MQPLKHHLTDSQVASATTTHARPFNCRRRRIATKNPPARSTPNDAGSSALATFAVLQIPDLPMPYYETVLQIVELHLVN